jgi:hypothetical protein
MIIASRFAALALGVAMLGCTQLNNKPLVTGAGGAAGSAAAGAGGAGRSGAAGQGSGGAAGGSGGSAAAAGGSAGTSAGGAGVGAAGASGHGGATAGTGGGMGLGGPCATGSFGCDGAQPLQCNAQTHLFEKSGQACGGLQPDCTMTGGCTCAGMTCSSTCVHTDSDVHHCGSCTKDCMFGTCQGGVCQPEKIGNACTSLAVDATAVFCLSNFTVRRTLIGYQQALFSDAGMGVSKLTVDGSGTLYYMHGVYVSTYNVMRVPTIGGTPTMMTTAQGPVLGMTVKDGVLYWTEAGSTFVMPPVPSQVVKVAANAQAQTATVIATGLSGAADIAVDGSYVYWTNSVGVQRVSRDVTGPTDPTIIKDTTSAAGSTAKSVLFDGKFVPYFVDGPASATLYKISDTPSLTNAPVMTYPNVVSGGLASDGVNAYFASTTDGKIVKQPLDGSASSSYDTGAATMQLGELVMDATTIYFVNGYGLYRLAKF